jgi:hypothetical protein
LAQSKRLFGVGRERSTCDTVKQTPGAGSALIVERTTKRALGTLEPYHASL